MKGTKRFVSLMMSALLCATAVPMDVTLVQADSVDAVVRLTPGEASTFNDTNGDGLGEFEGWGTSLCWWANRVGYSETLTSKAAKYFFSDEGLDMNIGRYNVGGGDLTGELEEVPVNENADFYTIADATYAGSKMSETTLTALASTGFTASDADFGFTKGYKVGNLTYIGWINELGTADDTSASGGNLHFNVTAEESGNYTVKILLTLSGSNERAAAIRVNDTTDYIVDADTINNNIIASGSNQKLFLVTISDVALNEGENKIDLGGYGDWTLDFVKMAVIKSDELGVLPEADEYLHSEHIIRSDSGVPGYCIDVTKMDLENHTLDYYKANFVAADEESGYAWNYDWDADANQLDILKAAISVSGDEFHAEAFSNSPPYFMTESGCSSGNTNSSKDNLRSDCYTAFATYMADVIQHLIEVEAIDIESATAMNEPYTSYWGAYSNKQEGCHFDQGDSQSKIITALHQALEERGIDLIISGTDETSIDTQITSYNALSDEAKSIVERIDTHTYSGSNRSGLKELAKSAEKNLWMSEVDGAYTGGTNAGEMSAALGLAQRMITDVNGLGSSAWILWNAIDMHVDSSEYGQSWVEKGSANDYLTEEAMYAAWQADDEDGYWGLAAANHDTEEILLTMKYYGYGQFSRYIRPGYTIIGTSSSGNTLAAYDSEGKKVVIVAMNTSEEDKTWSFDLSLFNEMSSDAAVTAIRTSGTMESGEKWADVSDSVNAAINTATKTVTADMKANSITTYMIEGVTYDPENPVTDSTVEIELTEDMVSGSDPWSGGTGNGVENAIDGNLSTFFDGVSNGYVLIDLGETTDISAVAYAPRNGYESRCVGAVISGSNDGETWDELYTVTNSPASGTLSYVYAGEFASGSSEYRYVKYAVDESGNCNIAEIKIYTSVPAIESVEDVTAVIYDGQVPELPEKAKGVTTTGEEYNLSVNWNLDNVDLTSMDLFEIAEITGTLTGSSLTAKATVMLIPEGLEYVIDCNHSNSAVWNIASSNVSTLLNTEASDQVKTDSNTWGSTSTEMTGYDGYDGETELYGYGWWAHTDADISYQVTLPKGLHTITLGCFGWNWGSRTMDITYSVNGQEEQSLCKLTAYNTSESYASGTIILTEESSVVTIHAKKGSGGDPILSWISVNALSASAESAVGVGYSDGTVVLPETVKVTEGDGVTVKDAKVNWNTDGVDFSVDPYNYVTVKGTVEGYNNLTTTAKVLVVPMNLEYMIDCNNTGSAEWNLIKENVTILLNAEAADQAKADSNTWGYTESYGAYNSDATPYSGGWYAGNNQNISYQVTLPAGKHTVMLGSTGWWSSNRDMDVYYTVADGEEQYLCEFDAVKNAASYVTAESFILSKESVVTITVKKAGTQDPILSWLSISSEEYVPEELMIVTHPEDTSARAGESVTFTVEATGEGLTYQWQYSNANSSKWYNSCMEGYNTPTITVPVANFRDGQKYRCIVTDGYGNSVISDHAVMTIEKSQTLAIAAQPVDYVGAVDEMAVFTVEAVGEGLTYQWQYSNANSSKWFNSSMEGNDSASIIVPIKSYRDGQKYRCIITDAEGYTVTTAVVYLEVEK